VNSGIKDPPRDRDGLTCSTDLLTLAGVGPADPPAPPALAPTPDRVAPDRVAPDRVAPDRVAPDRAAPECEETR
jgi:hypothetical protein